MRARNRSASGRGNRGTGLTSWHRFFFGEGRCPAGADARAMCDAASECDFPMRLRVEPAWPVGSDDIVLTIRDWPARMNARGTIVHSSIAMLRHVSDKLVAF